MNSNYYLTWADEARNLGVRANADTPEDAKKALEFGADGIGLCRTEHMFMDPKRIPIVQEMILAENLEERMEALDKLLTNATRVILKVFLKQCKVIQLRFVY